MGEIRHDGDGIWTLDPLEYVRLRPGMCIGKLGDGSLTDDGIYVLLKEVLDNSIDEFIMSAGKTIDVKTSDGKVEIRGYRRGIPLGKVVDVVSKMNTRGRHDSYAFRRSIGLNGVGTKTVNVLSSYFKVESVHDNQTKSTSFERGIIKEESLIEETRKKRGTSAVFIPNDIIPKNFKFRNEYTVCMSRDYVYLDPGLTINYSGEKYYSENELKGLLTENNNEEDFLCPIIHLKGEDTEVAISHSKIQYGGEYYSSVNRQSITQGGTHLNVFKEAYVKTIRDFYKKNSGPSDVCKSIIAGLSTKVMEPAFGNQTKTELDFTETGKGMSSMCTYINDFVTRHLDDCLHKNNEVADAILRKIIEAQRERRDPAGIKKLARERAKETNSYNKKLNDCHIHFADTKDKRNPQSAPFIAEGNLASGSITKSRDVNIQAIFSLRGKPSNTYGMTKRITYGNEGFDLLQTVLNIEDSIDDLRCDNIVIATDADVGGMHIRSLLTTSFLQFFPEIIKGGHLYTLQTPLFRVRNKGEKIYCHSEGEKRATVAKLKGKPEITCFKGLGEVSPDKFEGFISEGIRSDPMMLDETIRIEQLLDLHVGKNTPDRQDFIINNLKIEIDNLE